MRSGAMWEKTRTVMVSPSEAMQASERTWRRLPARSTSMIGTQGGVDIAAGEPILERGRDVI